MPKMVTSHEAAVLYGAKDLRLELVKSQELESHEVRIAIKATTICGTDLHYYQNGRNGIYKVDQPLILGHEAAGEVVAVGAGVTSLKVGDGVAIEPQMPCWACTECRAGRYNLCGHMRFRGSASAKPPAQGSMQQFLHHPASMCYKLPDGISFEEGAAVEPLSVALHSVWKAGIKAGETVLITGAGAIGLLCGRVARVAGASRVIMADVDGARLEFAKQEKLADEIFTMPMGSEPGELPSDFASRVARDISQHLGDTRPTTSFECTGVESCLNVCLHLASSGGSVVVVGMGRPVQSLSIGMALVKETRILPVWRYANTFPPAIELIANGTVNVKSLITHRFDVAEAAMALEHALSKPSDLIKTVLLSNNWK